MKKRNTKKFSYSAVKGTSFEENLLCLTEHRNRYIKRQQEEMGFRLLRNANKKT